MLALLLLALTSLSTASSFTGGHQSAPRDTTNPFTFTPAFIFDITIGASIPQISPPNLNGTVTVLVTTGGSVTGPLLNGTITGGLTTGSRFSDYYLGDSTNYGQTEDGLEFVLRQTGPGSANGKLSRVVSATFVRYSLFYVSFCLCTGRLS